MYNYKIERIRFNDGSEINPGPLTVIVGPNNCGKSRILKDIRSLTSDQKPESIVVNSVDYLFPDSVNDLIESCKIEAFRDENNNYFLRTLSSNLASQHNVHVGGADWKQTCQDLLAQKNENNIKQFNYMFGSFYVSLFETEERLKLIKETESSERGTTNNLLQAFYKEGAEVESKLREIVKGAFNKDIRLDYSSLRKILFRIGDDLDLASLDPREAIAFYDEHEKLDDQGDGIRSFVATILAILVGKRPVLLLDEPESFLHPPQSFRLGEVIAAHADNNRQIIVSTHSVDFLRGILSKRQDVTIIRVDRKDDINKINVLNSAQVASISQDPLLSSTRILDGLFYKGAIMVEADADSVFYQRISRQLDGADSYHIAHAHNKQTVAKVLYPYRTLGICFAAIVDFDVIRVEHEFRTLLTKLGMPVASINKAIVLQKKIVAVIENVDLEGMLNNQLIELETEIGRVKENVNKDTYTNLLKGLAGNLKRIRESGSSWKKYKKEGVSALDAGTQKIFSELSVLCSENGLFIVPVGELEGWLVKHGLPYTKNKSKWIVNALELIPKLNFNSEQPPWDFLQSVFTYLNSK